MASNEMKGKFPLPISFEHQRKTQAPLTEQYCESCQIFKSWSLAVCFKCHPACLCNVRFHVTFVISRLIHYFEAVFLPESLNELQFLFVQGGGYEWEVTVIEIVS